MLLPHRLHTVDSTGSRRPKRAPRLLADAGAKAAEREGTTRREGATEREALDLLRHVYLESLLQDTLEEKGYRSPTWRILRALQATINANVVIGETRLTAAPSSKVRDDRLYLFGDLSKGGE